MMKEAFRKSLDRLIAASSIVIDRPKGSALPRYPSCIYPVDYGYLADTSSQDGDGIDLWLGTGENRGLDAVLCTVDLLKHDSEIKQLIGCTHEGKTSILAFHNDSAYRKGILIERNEVMP